MRRRKKDQLQWARRVAVFVGLILIWALAIVLRLYYLQGPRHEEFLKQAVGQSGRTFEATPRRGDIYDRQGVPLAISVAVESIYAVPPEISNPDLTARLLAPILSVRRKELAARLQSPKYFCWVKRKVTAAEASRVKALKLKGVYTQGEMKRFYPKGELAAHVLGYVGLDGKGLASIEYKLDRVLQGNPGRVLLTSDSVPVSLQSPEWKARPGKGVSLTLDESIQYIAEKALDGVVRRYQAKGATVVVQEPHTGEILAMASRPSFNPNHYQKVPKENWINQAVAWAYEPGSTFKLITLAASLEEEVTTPDELIDCENGSLVVAGHRIRDHRPFGVMTTTEVLANSSNVGAMKLAQRVGEKDFYKYIERFGFGRPTGIALPGESRGLVRPPDQWSGLSLASLSLGQEIGVTPVQLVTAFSAIANDGILLRPRIVRALLNGSRYEPVQSAPGRRILSSRTSAELTRMLAAVVESGTGGAASPAGYSAAGKTGTAQKIDSTGGYSQTDYVASFAGFAPVSQPAITVLVVVDSPVGATYGADVAAPVFKSITEQTLTYLNVPHENPSNSLQVTSSEPGWESPQPEQDARANSRPTRSESPNVVHQPLQTLPLTRISLAHSGGPLFADLHPGLVLPDFVGQPLRDVARRCLKLGLELRIQGSGRAVQQHPEPGSRVSPEEEVLVRFTR
jgi:cell division protein FtsI (penicillin-binding protein 3)